MLKYNFINNLLNLSDVLVKNIVNSDDNAEIYAKTKKKPHVCPKCGSITSKVHDYRTQKKTKSFMFFAVTLEKLKTEIKLSM